jgi:hypothetical protein
MATHSYLKVEIYDNPAWESGTLEGTLTDITSVDVNLNRGLNPHTASFSLKNTGTDCDYAGKGVVITAYCNDSGSVVTDEVFRGFVIERKKIIDSRSLTHTGWEFECEDVMATWEAYEYDINMYDENGLSDSDIAPYTRPPKFHDHGSSFNWLIRHFHCNGNAMALFAEFRKQGGHVVSGRGDIDGLSESDNIQIMSQTETVPECEGIKIFYKKNNNAGSGTGVVKTIFMAKSQQWWVPIAWSEEDDDTGEYVLHIIYQTSIQHTKVSIGSESDATYDALYFDDESQSYTVIDESEIVTEEGTVPDYDYTLLGDITLIKPTDNSVNTNIMIHKSYTFTEAPESEEKTGASLIAQFKKELPDIMSLHISTGAANPRQEEYEYGDEPFQQEDVGYVVYGGHKTYPVVHPFSGEIDISLPEVIGTYVLERMAETQFTNEKQYQYTYSLVQKIPKPPHGDEGGNLYKKISSFAYDNPDYIVESTRLSWDGDGVNISTTIRYKSDKTAAYKRISKYNLPRYFKKQMTTEIEKISEADYAKIDGDSIIFTIDGEDVKISLTDNILTDDGIVRW